MKKSRGEREQPWRRGRRQSREIRVYVCMWKLRVCWTLINDHQCVITSGVYVDDAVRLSCLTSLCMSCFFFLPAFYLCNSSVWVTDVTEVIYHASNGLWHWYTHTDSACDSHWMWHLYQKPRVHMKLVFFLSLTFSVSFLASCSFIFFISLAFAPFLLPLHSHPKICVQVVCMTLCMYECQCLWQRPVQWH